MIQLESKDLSIETQSRLDNLQREVDLKTTFADKAKEAKRLWGGKKGANAGKVAFEEVTSVLEDMCVSKELCNYCEQNEANDIEHIAPKSFFPESAFVWDNYLLACKQCNSGYKLDKCFVIDAANSTHELARRTQPTVGSTIAFINPRVENPNTYMMLNMLSYKFDIHEDLSLIKKHKAEKTLEILKLNERDELIHARKNASKYMYLRLEQLIKIIETNSNQELENILTPDDDVVDTTKSLENNKTIIIASFKKDIQMHQHPSVWYAIKKVQSKVNAKWQKLFEKLPEALTW